MKINSPKYIYLITFLTVQCLLTLSVTAQPLPVGWWDDPPEIIIQHAETITSQIPFYYGRKLKLIDGSSGGFEIFQRRLTGGTIETKKVRKVNGRIQSYSYDISTGRYFIDSNKLIFHEDFLSGDQIEASLAQSIAHPYGYSLLGKVSAFIGTNECYIIRRLMEKSMFEAIAKEFYQGKNEQQIAMLAPQYVRAAKDYYVRKNDGIIIGNIKRNISASELLEDNLPDELLTGAATSAGEFDIQNINKAIKVSSMNELINISSKFGRKDYTPIQTSEHMRALVRFVLILLVATPLIALVAIKYFRPKSRN